MKTNERLRSPALEALLHTTFETGNEHIKINAQNYADANLPKPFGDNMNSYFEEDHLRYQHLVDGVNKELQFKTTVQRVADHARATETRLRELNNKHLAAREKQIGLDAEFKKTPHPKGYIRQVLTWIATIIISLFEGILSIPVYERWGYSFIESVLMGLLFAAVLAILAHSFLKIVFLGRIPWQRRLIAFLLLFFLGVLFKYMADVRADYLTGLVNANALNRPFSPWPFVGISLLLFTAAVAVNHFFMPSRAERDALREYQRLRRQKQETYAEIAELEAARNTVQEEHDALKASSASILEYANMLEESVITHAKSGYALWKKHNLMHRRDGIKPDCFDQGYPFSFNTNFHTIKAYSHEINH